MNQPRLLVVADTFEGGLGAAAVRHAQSLAGTGWDVGLAGPSADDRWPDVRALEIPTPQTVFDLRGMRASVHALRALLLSMQPDVVHAHGLRSHAMCLAAGRRPFVTFHGGGRLPGQRIVATVLRVGYRTIAPVLALKAFSVIPGSGPGWHTLITASPLLNGLAAREAHEMSSAPLFVWVGRLSPQKRPDVFVEAIVRASHTVPQVRGLMLGGGPGAERLLALIRERAAPIEVVGEVHDIAAYVRQAWGFTLFSHFEGLPFALQEAMWLGVAPVVTRLPGAAWLLGPEGVFAAEADEAATALVRLCDRQMAFEAGQRAATRVRELIDVNAPLPMLLKAYSPWA